MSEKVKVFLSYSIGVGDEELVQGIVEHLYNDLIANGVDVWAYERCSIPPAPFREQYLQAIRECDFFIVFCNESARNSTYIEEEIKTALQSNKAIIPVRFDAKSPHPLLDALELATVPCFEVRHRNRGHLFFQIARSLGPPAGVRPSDKFRALDQIWKVYNRDPNNYPICDLGSIRLEGTPSYRMDIQTETAFKYASLHVVTSSNWQTDTSVGFEKWYENRRYSIVLQGDGNIWIRRARRFFGKWKSENYPIKGWQQMKRYPVDLRVNWKMVETVIYVTNVEICRMRTQIHLPLNVRFNADFDDYVDVTYLALSESHSS